jgi:hypothetical protein
MKAPTQLRTGRGHLQDMKLSVPNSTSRKPRVSSLTTTNQAQKNLSHQKYLQLREAAIQFSSFDAGRECQLPLHEAVGIARSALLVRYAQSPESQAYTLNHRGGQ